MAAASSINPASCGCQATAPKCNSRTENGAAKVTPLEMYPTKGRATGGVRSQRFLKGQNTLILAWAGLYPLHASTSAGSPVELPKPDMRRDGSGVDLASPIAFIA